MLKIVIVQPDVREYRKGIYSLLGNHEVVSSLTILVPGHSKRMYNGFNVEPIKSFQFGSFVFLSSAERLLEEADVIIAMFDIKWSCALLWPFTRWRHKLVLWGHGFGRTRNHPIARWLRIMISKRVPALLFYDSKSRNRFIDIARVQNSKCFTAPNTMVVDTATTATNYQDRKDFIFVGRLLSNKKVLETIAAFLASSAPAAGSVFHLIGDGPERIRIEETLANSPMGKQVKLYGKVTDGKDLHSLFCKSLAFVSSGQLGLAIVHSMAHGVPIVFNKEANHGPEVHYLNNGNAISYSVFDQSLSLIISEIFTSPDEYLSLSENCYNTYLKKCSPQLMVEGMVDAAKKIFNNDNC